MIFWELTHEICEEEVKSDLLCCKIYATHGCTRCSLHLHGSPFPDSEDAPFKLVGKSWTKVRLMIIRLRVRHHSLLPPFSLLLCSPLWNNDRVQRQRLVNRIRNTTSTKKGDVASFRRQGAVCCHRLAPSAQRRRRRCRRRHLLVVVDVVGIVVIIHIVAWEDDELLSATSTSMLLLFFLDYSWVDAW